MKEGYRPTVNFLSKVAGSRRAVPSAQHPPPNDLLTLTPLGLLEAVLGAFRHSGPTCLEGLQARIWGKTESPGFMEPPLIPEICKGLVEGVGGGEEVSGSNHGGGSG